MTTTGKQARQQAILDAVSREELRTQQDIVRALRRRGIRATQVSVSRDVVELGLIKAGGLYRPSQAPAGAPDPELPLRTWVRSVQAAGQNLVVVRCDPGTAQGVARVLDQELLPGIVGTVAGDDTIFIAVASAKANDEILSFIKARIPAS